MLRVRFLVKAHTSVAGLIPGQSVYRRQPMDLSLIDVSLSRSLSLSKKQYKKNVLG